jgi:TatA/E family protein of Tat protein translocase
MFGISMWELLLVALLLFIVVGPKKLPELAKSLGKALGKFRESVDDLKKDVDIEDELKLLQQARSFSPRKLLEDEIRKPIEQVEPPRGPKSKKPQREGRHRVSPGAKKPPRKKPVGRAKKRSEGPVRKGAEAGRRKVEPGSGEAAKLADGRGEEPEVTKDAALGAPRGDLEGSKKVATEDSGSKQADEGNNGEPTSTEKKPGRTMVKPGKSE